MVPVRLALSLLKYGLLSLVITGAGLLIANTSIMKWYKSETVKQLPYKARPSVKTESSVLDKNFLRCLTAPSMPFCVLSSNRRLELLRNQLSSIPTQHPKVDVMSSLENPTVHPVYAILEDFKNLMHSLNVTPVLLEPSILFCMLSPLHKYNLISSGLKPLVLRDSPDTITFGIKEMDSKVLHQESSINKTLQHGYRFSRSRKWLVQPHAKDETVGDFFTTQYFYYRQDLTIQVVVFFDKGNFLWNPGVAAKEFNLKDDFFTRNFAYENFTFVPLKLENGKETGFYLPSDIIRFMFQVQNSEFRECPPTSGEDLHPPPNSNMTIEQLKNRVLIAIQELKSDFGVPWLWNDTLYGWNENCNIFQKTLKFNVAVDAVIISKLDLNLTFAGSYLQLLTFPHLKNITQKFIVDCYGLQINIFPIYGNVNSVWYFEENFAGELIRVKFSRFRICSVNLMEQLVYVPCGKELKGEITD